MEKGRFGTAGWSTAVWYMPGKMERLLKIRGRI